ncbi:MAG TPA: ECF-type sigma factor [Thermoanaerobaculia bacterium]|nr:ECF-type sigma factor [Thermoanaerobaculia bacterium]
MTDASVTAALRAWRGGDARAQDELMQLVYPELHRRAERLLARERPGHTLQPTALISELYLRLVDQRQAQWQDRAHFFAIAARLMRRVLLDHARRHGANKRGAHVRPLPLDLVGELPADAPRELEALDEALGDLAALDATAAAVVELRFFGGMSVEETATVLGSSTATVGRQWRAARAWLHARLAVDGAVDGESAAATSDAPAEGEA